MRTTFSDMSFIELNSVSVSYGDTDAIRDVSFSVEKGSFVSIIGPFGSGKTTLLRAVSGLLAEFEGSITIGGELPHIVKQRREIGFGFQQPTLLPWLNVSENISLPAKLTEKPYYTTPEELLSLAGMQDMKDKKIDQLSGGMRQLVSILRSLVLSPGVLLLDEPFSSIDEMTKDVMQGKLKSIHTERGLTTVMVTHSLSEAVYLSDYVIVLSARPSSVKSIIRIDFPRTSIDAKYGDIAADYVRTLRSELCQ